MFWYTCANIHQPDTNCNMCGNQPHFIFKHINGFKGFMVQGGLSSIAPNTVVVPLKSHQEVPFD